MLAELAEVGIALRPGVEAEGLLAARTRLVAAPTRASIEKSGFELLLVVMGEELVDPRTFDGLGPLSDDVWHFDTEAIEDHGSYKRIVDDCRRLSGGELKAESIQDYVDVRNKIAWVERSIDGRTQHVDLKVRNDWVDPKIFDHLQAWLDESGSGRRFAMQGLGQDLLLICKQPEQIKVINRATGLNFSDHLNI